MGKELMAPAITIRNLAAETITLVNVEQFQDPDSLQSGAAGYLFNPRGHSTATLTSPELGKHAQSFQHEEINAILDPFEAYSYESSSILRNASMDSSSELSTRKLRLTIKIGLEDRFRIDINPLNTQKSSQRFTALSSTTSAVPEGLFHPSNPSPHLTIHTNHKPNFTSWMQTLPDVLPLSAISIPGTHNSHAHYRALPSVRCQNLPIKTQLEHGIRFLDIRLQPAHSSDTSQKDLYLVHGAFPISLTGRCYFAPVLQLCYDFLRAHPSETILLSLKREGVGSATDEHLSSILQKHYILPDDEKWYVGESIPCLGAVRGKIVLIRRFHTSSPAISVPSSTANTPSILISSPTPAPPLGLNATPWPHSSPLSLFPPFCLQDVCDLPSPSHLPAKLLYATSHLARAAACTHPIPGISTDAKNPVPAHPLFLNFLTASNFWNKGVWPGKVAGVVNEGVEAWVCRVFGMEGEEGEEEDVRSGGVVQRVKRRSEGDACTGVVIMDFIGENGDWDLVKLVIGMNMGVLMKIKRLSIA